MDAKALPFKSKQSKFNIGQIWDFPRFMEVICG